MRIIISTFATILAVLVILVAAVSGAEGIYPRDDFRLVEYNTAASVEVADFEESMSHYEAELERNLENSTSLALQTSELEERQLMDVVKGIKEVVMVVFHAVKNAIDKDKSRRSQFTRDMVAQLAKSRRHMNFVMCHTDHTTKFDGKKGVDWYHEHKEFEAKLGGSIGYEIYGFKSGEFTRKGDGGYLNWAYRGHVIKSDDGGKHLVFGKRK